MKRRRKIDPRRNNSYNRKQIKVTVSIELASSGGKKADPEKVIQAADKKL
jgi:GGDEF domain-containing protein